MLLSATDKGTVGDMTGVWLAVRLTGIAIGIITLLGFASGYLGVELKPYFKNVLDWLEQHLVDFIVRPEEIEWALDYLRQHFAWVPKPEPHWKPIYTLSALLLLSVARHGGTWYAIPVALACSLLPAVFAGTVPVGSPAVAGLPFAGLCAFAAVAFALPGKWGHALVYLIGAAAFATISYFADNTVEGTDLLVLAAAFAGFAGFLLLVSGLLSAKGTIVQRLQVPPTAMGLDITAPLGGALVLGYVFAA